MSSVKQMRLFVVAVLACAVLSIGLPATSHAAVQLYPGCLTSVLPANDDDYTGAVPLGFDFFFGGQFYSSLNINNNGYVVFGSQAPIWWMLHSWQLFNVPLIALFHTDIDTRAMGSGKVTYGNIVYNGLPAFCVNWVNVGYFDSKDDKLNEFQLILVSRNDRGVGDADVYMNYDRILWDTPGGTSAMVPPRAGIYDGTTIVEELPGSNAFSTFLDSNPTGLVLQAVSSLILGQYKFELQGGLPRETAVVTGTVLDTNGAPMVGSLVQACDSCLGVDAPCAQDSTDITGRYSLSGFDPDSISQCPGWIVTASPPAGSLALQNTLAVAYTATDQVIADANLLLRYPAQVPSGSSIVPSRGGGGGSVPTVFWAEPLTLTTIGCGPVLGLDPPVAMYTITEAGSSTAARSGPMIDTPPAPTPPPFGLARYVAIVPPLSPIHGLVTVALTLICPTDDGPVTNTSTFDVYIDPSGFVQTTHGVPLEGAQVTLLRADSPLGIFEIVPDGSAIMSPKNRNNPDYTDGSGHFGWDTLSGFYVVRAEYPGCVSPSNPDVSYVETDILPVPPEWLDLRLYLDCEGITPPEITLPTQVLAEATSSAGAMVKYQATAHDGRDGAVPVVCSPASEQQFPLGTTLVTCSASDSSGNVAHGSFPVTVSYAWSNVLPPLQSDGNNHIKRGRTVPVEFALTGASAGIRNLIARLYLAPVVNGVPGTEVPARSADRHSSGARFRYDQREREYEFKWSTKGLPVGVYQLRVDLGDGVSHTVSVELRPRKDNDHDDHHDQ